jgi:hypothetical protein
MSYNNDRLCLLVLEQLQKSHPTRITRVEVETLFDNYKTPSDAIESLGLGLTHLIDLEHIPDWDMDGDHGEGTGFLCIAFENTYDGTVTILDQVCERDKNGVPFMSEAWMPENNFNNNSIIPLSEQKEILMKRYCDGHPYKPLIFKFTTEDYEQDPRWSVHEW